MREPMTITAPSAAQIARARRYKRPVILRRADLIPGDRIGDAVFEGFNRTHSKFWHKQRGTGVGGSDVAAIAGCSKYASPYTFWAERTGKVERVDDGKNADAKLWGAKLERVVAETFAARHPELVVMTWPEGWGASFRHHSREFQLGSPDGLLYDPVTGEWGILEVKTARHEYEWRDPDLFTPAVPAYYLTQDQWYLDVFGFSLSFFATLFAGSSYRETEVRADPFEQGVNRRQVLLMLDLIASDTPPKWDGSESTYETVKRMHPDIAPKKEVELAREGDQYLTALRNLADAEEAMLLAKAVVVAAMDDAQYGTYNGSRIVGRQSNRGGTPFLVSKVK